MKEHENNFADTLRFLGRGSLMAIAAALVCGFVGYVATFRQPVTFTATSTVYTTSKAPNNPGLGLAFYRVDPMDADSYAFAATSYDVLRDALQQLQLQRLRSGEVTTHDVANLAKSIHISTDSTTNAEFVHVSAESSSPASAADTANAVASSLISWDNSRSRANLEKAAATLESQINSLREADATLASSSDTESARMMTANQALIVQRTTDLGTLRVLMKQNTGTLTFLEVATPPLHPSGPSLILNFIVAFIIGLVVGYVLVAVYEALRLDRRHAARAHSSRLGS